ncbi:MAG: endolytic transglycosylase MltG [bacterium]
MKWRIILSLFAVLGIVGCGLVGTVLYYHFDWSDLADISFYENLANPSMRIVRVQEGLRKEQVADVLGSKLGWDDAEKNQFVNAHLALNTTNSEGYYFPKSYIIQKDEGPITISNLMFDEFQKQTSKIIKPKKTKIVNEDTALKIASIIQREAAGKNDMRLISGIIWNRIFKGMKLQMDATLQYAKGTENDWWPQVDPKDKQIDSPYNTYMYPSLPPSPIANPGLAAIEAAYNPQPTNCLFYLHDKKGQIHCSATYEGHKANIARYY